MLCFLKLLIIIINCAEYNVGALSGDRHYIGPDDENRNECVCSKVMYNMIGGCSTCQNLTIIRYALSLDSLLMPFFVCVRG